MNEIQRRPFVAVLFLAILFFASCEKPEDSIGLGLQQEEDLLSIVVDTISFSAATIPGDSTRTSLSQAIVLLGEFDHPIIGRAKSVFHTQIRPSALGVDFGEGFVCDSLVLSLEYTGLDSVYGDPSAVLDFSVFRLDEDLDVDSVYYSDKEFITSGDDWMLPGAEQQDLLGYPTVIDGDTVASQLRLHLDTLYGRTVFYEESFNGILDDVDGFMDFFKGLRVEATTTMGLEGAIGSFDANASATKLTMYYHNDSDTSDIDFFINTFSQRNLYFDLSPSMDMQAQFDDPSRGDQELFVQAMTGANIQVNIDLDDFADDTLAINKAELVFQVNDEMQDFDIFPAPSRIFGVYTDSDGDITSIPDVLEGEEHSDGLYNESDKEYRVNVTSFLQRALTGEINTSTLTLLPVSNSGTADFVHLYGIEAPDKEARLIVTYTKF